MPFTPPGSRVILGEMTLAVPGTTGFVAPARCAVIKHEGKYFAAVAAPDVRDRKYGGWRIIGRPDQTRLWGPGNDESPRIESKGRWARSNHWAQSARSPQYVHKGLIAAIGCRRYNCRSEALLVE